MPLTLDVFLDPICPHSYMAFRAARALAARGGVRVRWQPLPVTGDSGLTRAQRQMHTLHRDAAWPSVQALAAARFGLELGKPGPAADGRPAAATALWLAERRAALVTELLAALFGAHFDDGQDIGDPDVLATLVRGLGFDPAGLREALAADALAGPLAQTAARAEGHGVTAVPALVAEGYLLLGAQPTDVLERTLEQVALARTPTPTMNGQP